MRLPIVIPWQQNLPVCLGAATLTALAVAICKAVPIVALLERLVREDAGAPSVAERLSYLPVRVGAAHPVVVASGNNEGQRNVRTTLNKEPRGSA